MRALLVIVRDILTSEKWRRSLVLALLFTVACAGLSWWQFARGAETSAANKQLAAVWNAAPVSLDSVLSEHGALASSDEWRSVRLTGTYLTEKRLLLENSSLNGNPGYEVLEPFRLTDGRVFVVDRGWVSIGKQQMWPSTIPSPPSGTVTVVARLQPGSTTAGRIRAPGQIDQIDLTLIAKHVGLPTVTGAYGLLVSEHPSAGTMPVAFTEPSYDTGTHISYAIQWIAFAVIAFVALGWSVRRDLLDAGDPDVLESEERAIERRARRDPSDEEVEDRQLSEV